MSSNYTYSNTCKRSTNQQFYKFAVDLKSDWETDKASAPKTESDIVNQLNAKWNNRCATKCDKVINETKSNKIENDPKYLAMFTVLTSSIKGLSEQVQQIQKSNMNKNNLNKNNNPNIAEWRKEKNHGEEVFKDGKQFYWCPNHQEGKGLYVTHHPLDHGKHPRDFQHTRKHKQAVEESGTNNKKKLQLTESMKAAMTSNGISDEAADAMLSSLSENGSMDFW